MLLSPTERILLLNILPPAEGNAMYLRSARRLRAALAFSDQEIIDWKITNPSAGVFNWDVSASGQVEIELTPMAETYLINSLKAADAAGRLHEGLLYLYDKFFPES